jgi:hypothetical protein
MPTDVAASMYFRKLLSVSLVAAEFYCKVVSSHKKPDLLNRVFVAFLSSLIASVVKHTQLPAPAMLLTALRLQLQLHHHLTLIIALNTGSNKEQASHNGSIVPAEIQQET